MGSAMASMPHYMSQGVNEVTAKGVEKAVNGLYSMTLLGVTAVEEIVLFVINMMVSTYLCLITLAVRGSVEAVAEVITKATDELNNILQPLGDDMAKIIDGFGDEFNSLVDALNGVSILSTIGVDIPKLPDLSPDLDKLKNVQIPDDVNQAVISLNESLPTFAEVKNFTDNAIRFPFEQVKDLINGSLGTYTFDRSVFPVPQKEQLSFCSDDDGINDFFDNLGNIAEVTKKIFLGVLIAAAILACVPMAYREVKRWRTMQERAQLVASSAHDPMDVVYIVSRPYTSTTGIKMSSYFRSSRRQILTRWVIAYATTDAALFVLALAVAGLFSCLCQLVLLRSLEKEVPALSAQVGDFADKVIVQLNNASEQWALGTNDVISRANSDINEQMFGWVNTSTDAINDTLNTFIETTSNVLNTTFGGTPLYTPIQGVFDCLIGLKVAGFQKALTWVEDNAHVNFPLMPNDTFSIGAVASIAGDQQADASFLATPGDEASDKISSAVARFINKLEEAIKTEAIISTFVLLVWVIVVLIGIVRALTLWYGRDKTRGEGGAPARNVPPTPAAVPDFRTDNQDRYQNFQDIPLGSTKETDRSYTPAPNYSKDDPFSDITSGYAGQREDTRLGRTRTGIRSERGSIWQGDHKI
jgi:hypothetical protein